MTTEELCILVDRVAEIVRSRGQILRDSYGKVGSYSSKADFASNVVTDLDTKIEEYLRVELKKLLPLAAFVGEEQGVFSDEQIYWIVDPIDGTSHYIRGLPFCTSIVGLVDNGEVILSVIYNFVSDELFTCIKGGGAYLNGIPIRVSNRPINGSLISYDINLEKDENITYFADLCTRTGGLFNSINCGYELSMIACGKIDAKVFISPYAKEWDFAAGCLLISEAGGIVRNLGRQSFSLKNPNFYVSNPTIATDLDSLFSSF